MREARSSETIKLSSPRVDSPQPSAQFEDPNIFDLFQSKVTTTIATGTGSHSIHTSTTASSFESTAQQSTFSSAPGDDPRFIIWMGYSYSDASSFSKPGSMGTGTGGGHQSSLSLSEPASRSNAHSPALSSSDQGSPIMGSGSARWSLKDRISIISGEERSSAPTSIRNSMASTSANRSKTRDTSRLIRAATVERLVAELTSKIELDLLTGFFLTYRSFVRPVDLCKLLVARFTWAMSPTSSPEDDAGRRIVRVRTFVVLRHWLLNHFTDDFVPDRPLRTYLTDWLNRSGKEERFRASPKDMRLIKGLKKLVRRLKETYVAASDSKRDPSDKRSLNDTGGHLRSTSSSIRVNEAVSDEDLDFDALPSPRAPSAPTSATVGLGLGIDSATLLPTRSTVMSDLNTTFPLPIEQTSSLARTFSAALGSISRFKRMIISTKRVTKHVRTSSAKSMDAFDELEFEAGATADLLYCKGGVERYLAFFDVPVGSEQDGTTTGIIETKEEIASEEGEGGMIDPVHLDNSKDEMLSPSCSLVSMNSDNFMVNPEPTPIARFSLSGPTNFNNTSLDALNTTGSYDYLHHATSGGFLNRPPSTRIELDDVDLSDEDDDVVEVKRTLKRMPIGFQQISDTTGSNSPSASTATPFRPMMVGYQPERRSIDTVSSYGSTRDFTATLHQPFSTVPTYLSKDEQEELEHEARLREGTRRVEHFVLEGMESDEDDEPGDIEAALRRLEGQVDESLILKKKGIVEAQMEKSRELEKYKALLETLGTSLEIFRPPSDSSAGGSVADDEEDSGVLEAAEVEITQLPLPPVASSPLPSPPRQIKKKSSIRDFLTRPFALSPIPPAPVPARSILPTHRSFLLQCSTEIIAQQFCLIERDLVRVVGWQELVGGSWRDRIEREQELVVDWDKYLKERRDLDREAKKAGDKTHVDVQAIIARFNLMANWVCSEVGSFFSNFRARMIDIFSSVDCSHQSN
jgi:GDP/GTP exchange factor required for growth at low temperature